MPDAVPNYITIDPITGAVGADFSGHVHAAGIDLDAGLNATPPDTDRVRWLRANGISMADLYATHLGGVGARDTGGFTMYSDGISPSNAHLTANDGAGGNASLADVVALSDPINTQAKVYIEVKNVVKTLLDGNGLSDYLQLALTQKVSIDFGITLVTFAAGQGAATVSHNLGVSPTTVVASAVALASNAIAANSANFSPTTFTLQCRSFNAALAAGVNICWLAIG